MSSVSWILLTADHSASGITMNPMRQLAMPYAFDSEYSEIVCAPAPSIDPAEKFTVLSYVKYS